MEWISISWPEDKKFRVGFLEIVKLPVGKCRNQQKRFQVKTFFWETLSTFDLTY